MGKKNKLIETEEEKEHTNGNDTEIQLGSNEEEKEHTNGNDTEIQLDSNQKRRKKKKKQKKDKWGQPVVENAHVADERNQICEGATNNNTECLGSEDKYDRKKIVVGGMPYSTTEEEILQFFKDCGPISELDRTTFPDTGNFRGLAFITFQTEDAARSGFALDGTKMGNRLLKIEPCRIGLGTKRKREFLNPPIKSDGCLSAYIGNLPWDVTENDIRHFFEGCKIASLRLAVNKATGKFRGFGHIDFADDESLECAIKKNQKLLHDRPIRIAYAVQN